ncbi:hypothetical protein LguiA_016298 [Lonicera macranthoides]
MTKIDILRRYILPCFSPAAPTPSRSPATTTTTKKRLSTSLRDDIIDSPTKPHSQDSSSNPTTPSSSSSSPTTAAPPRPSKTMAIGTIFGQRRGHVWFCVQHDRLSTKPSLLLELSIPTHLLVKEMSSGLVRVALESDLGSCPLHSVPVWTMYCNGRKLGFATRRKANEQIRVMLKTMQSTTVGAGVIPSGSGSGSDEGGDIMYMRANYECVVGGPDSESFHLINPDDCPGQELMETYVECCPA